LSTMLRIGYPVGLFLWHTDCDCWTDSRLVAFASLL